MVCAHMIIHMGMSVDIWLCMCICTGGVLCVERTDHGLSRGSPGSGSMDSYLLPADFLSSIGNSKIPNSAKAISEDKAQGHGLHVYLATDSPDNGSSRLDMETAQDRAAAHGG